MRLRSHVVPSYSPHIANFPELILHHERGSNIANEHGSGQTDTGVEVTWYEGVFRQVSACSCIQRDGGSKHVALQAEKCSV